MVDNQREVDYIFKMNEEEKAAKLLELDNAMFDFMRAASRVRDIAWELEMEKLEN